MVKEKCDAHEDCMTQLALHENHLKQHDAWLKDMNDNIKSLSDKLIGRPSWLITIVITSLSTTTVALAVYIITNSGAK